MILHIVLFEPRTSLTDEDRRAILESLAAAAAGIPSVVSCQVGRRVIHGLPGYEQAMRTNYEYALLVECADQAGLQAYLAHPLHLEFGRHFTESAASGLAYDYELQGVESFLRESFLGDTERS